MTRAPVPVKTALADAPPDALQRNWQEIRKRRVQRPNRRPWLAVAACALAGVAAVAVLSRDGGDAPRAVAPLTIENGEALASLLASRDVREPLKLELSDSSVIRLEAGADLEAVENTGADVKFRLRTGRVHFEVEFSDERRWTVVTDLFSIEVAGTVFAVARDDRGASVTVELGTIRLTSDHLQPRVREVGAGETVRVEAPRTAARGGEREPEPQLDPDPEPEPKLEPRPKLEPKLRPELKLRPEPKPEPEPRDSTWREAATKGEPKRAYELLGSEGIARESKKASSAQVLWTLADIARKSGNPIDSLSPLRRLVANHPSEAAVASYTLGRVLLFNVKRPAKAAKAFERAISLGLPSSLAAAAHARVVEAYARAKNSEAATRSARKYLEKYADGREVERVKKWGGL